MATVQQLVDDAAILFGGVAAGENISGDQATQVLRVFNRFLDSLNAKRNVIYQITDFTGTLVADQQTYLIGTSGSEDFTTTRPVKIEAANIVNTTPDPDERWPVAILDYKQWARRFTEHDYEYPTALYYEPSFPDGTINLFDVPTSAHTLELFVWQQFSAAATIGTTVTYPPGYEEMIVHNIAVRIAPIYGTTAPPEIKRLAQKGLADVQSLNAESPAQGADYGAGADPRQINSVPASLTWR